MGRERGVRVDKEEVRMTCWIHMWLVGIEEEI
jgi:hypothetical protein